MAYAGQSFTVLPVKTGIHKGRDRWIPAGVGRTVYICDCPGKIDQSNRIKS